MPRGDAPSASVVLMCRLRVRALSPLSPRGVHAHGLGKAEVTSSILVGGTMFSLVFLGQRKMADAA